MHVDAHVHIVSEDEERFPLNPSGVTGPWYRSGVALGLALSAPYYAYSGGYYDGDSVAYCMSRFRSYDPATGTYLGFDGLRHPCP